MTYQRGKVYQCECNLETILNSCKFTILKSLLDEYDLTSSVLNLENGTIYLPTNCAFQKIQSILETLTSEQILNILLYHVSEQQVTESGNNVLCSLNLLPLLSTNKYVNNIKIKYSCTSNLNTVNNVINTVLIPFDPTTCDIQPPS